MQRHYQIISITKPRRSNPITIPTLARYPVFIVSIPYYLKALLSRLDDYRLIKTASGMEDQPLPA